MIREFKPALMFLGKFLLVYFLGNLLYGFFVESFGEKPDPITAVVSEQSAWVLNRFGYDTDTENHPTEPKVMLKDNGLSVLNVYEGCNGVNVMIVFLAFLVAYGGRTIHLVFFSLAGLVAIHLVNLVRVSFLFHLAYNNAQTFYLYHKYFFTATLYAVVFLLWAVWVIRFNENANRATTD